ncbi:uncharacterized protein LOC129179559 isoform X3 [Dunckerocampus dactyliophorus]|uniref:uncharacterized protein LOC129179559 isoform X3 n=1 Tax=Dunckerocampus dactyliophorus TaxID=161453 RepID=UPI002406DE35|nr:uncharacterized protein LOC129179559 isoform X3 [Dunckerocampus dactyliophorus]
MALSHEGCPLQHLHMPSDGYCAAVGTSKGLNLGRRPPCVLMDSQSDSPAQRRVGGCSSRAQVLYQRPGSWRVLRSILAVPRTALFWTEMSDVSPGICWSHFSSVGDTVPIAPMTTDVQQPPHIKEETEELWIAQKGECPFGPEEADLTKSPPAAACVKTEDPEDVPQADHLLAPLSDSDDTALRSPEAEDWGKTQELLSSDTDCEGGTRTRTDNKSSECAERETDAYEEAARSTDRYLMETDAEPPNKRLKRANPIYAEDEFDQDNVPCQPPYKHPPPPRVLLRVSPLREDLTEMPAPPFQGLSHEDTARRALKGKCNGCTLRLSSVKAFHQRSAVQ